MNLPSLSRAALPALALLLAACGGGGVPIDGPGPSPDPRAVPAGQPAETGAYVVTIGRDTLAVEQYARAGNQLTGELVTRAPNTVRRAYTAELRPDGSIARFEMTSRNLTAAPTAPATVMRVEFAADSARTRIERGDSVRASALAAPATAFPIVGNSYAIYEQAIRHVRAGGAGRRVLTFVPPGGNQTYEFTFDPLGADSVLITNVAGRQRAAVDAQGRLVGLNGLESTQKFIVTRVPSVDIDALAAEYARRDATGRGVGALSPRDSAVLEVGGARVAVDYGRPFKRGRQVFGGIVPWGEVWRTGANAATGFRTTRDLVIGGTPVPAGAYTLWTLPTPEGWKLIVNRQTGQWGTEYHAEQDLARIDMRTRRVAEPVEQFTIAVVPEGSGGAIRLAWDDLEAWVPFEVR